MSHCNFPSVSSTGFSDTSPCEAYVIKLAIRSNNSQIYSVMCKNECYVLIILLKRVSNQLYTAELLILIHKLFNC